jgi:adenylylsulfate kinase
MTQRTAFAIWMTGLPASGKSTITRELAGELRKRTLPLVVLESDTMRTILTPEPVYRDEERDRFYRALTLIGEMLIRSGVNVIFDATANKREYRDFARALISRFMEVYVHCPLDICVKRDPKGIYSLAADGKSTTVPGLQSPYEPPLLPEVTVDGNSPPHAASLLIVQELERLQYV